MSRSIRRAFRSSRPARKCVNGSTATAARPRPAPEADPISSNAREVMRKFLTAMVLIPLGLVFIVFAVANRHLVTVSFDPFNSTDPSVAVAILGVVAGGCATWFRQRHWRRAARQHEADARQARTQLAELRAGAMTPSRYDPLHLPAPPQGGGYGVSGRDKQGATL